MELQLSAPSPLENMHFDNVRDPQPSVIVAEKPVRAPRRSLVPALLLLATTACGVLVAFEMHTAYYSAKHITEYAKTLTYQLQANPAQQVVYPDGRIHSELARIQLAQ